MFNNKKSIYELIRMEIKYFIYCKLFIQLNSDNTSR